LPHNKRNIDAVGGAVFWRRRGLLASLLYPVSLCFAGLVWLRLLLYRLGVLQVQRLPVPVVVIGNLTVGGTGKTPLILYLANALRAHGMQPGIISRGYRGRHDAASPGAQRVGAKNKDKPLTALEVLPTSDPHAVGDEPLLLARRSQCPVFVCRDRVAAGRALLSRYPACDVILSDDGLQHYRLGRDVDIAVFDHRGVMNGWQLPAGPLREPLSRLRHVDAIVLNNTAVSPAPTFCGARFAMALTGQTFYCLDQPHISRDAADFFGQRLHAVAGIGSPQRFFDHLTALGLSFEAHPLADHHDYQPKDLNFTGGAILTTEKDAVKLAALKMPLPVWVLPVTANLSPDLAAFILEKINGLSSA
jgi:tetraacyldisaccharide 4'-kinase